METVWRSLTPPCLSLWVNLSLTKLIVLTCEGHFCLLSTGGSFYKLWKKDETKYAEATSAATNISFQYNICLYQLTLNYKTGVAAEQDRIKVCSRISRATWYAADVRYIWRSIATDNISSVILLLFRALIWHHWLHEKDQILKLVFSSFQESN